MGAVVVIAALFGADYCGLHVQVNGTRYCVEPPSGARWGASCRAWAQEDADTRLNEFARRVALASAAFAQSGKRLTDAEKRAILGTGR